MAQDDNGLRFALTTTPAEPKCGEDIALHLTVNAIDGPVEVSALLVAIPVGSTATDLTPVALPQNVPTKAPDGWNEPEITGGSTVHVTPLGNGTVIIDDHGLEFSVGKVLVNAQASVAQLTVTAKLKDGTFTSPQTLDVKKTQPDIAVEIHLDEMYVPYGEHAVLNWTATPRSTVVIGFRGTQYRTILNDPNETPLPSSGTYRIENITDTVEVSVETASCIPQARTSPVIQRIRTIPTT